MLPTPSTSHVSLDNVYEPAEDSFLLLDTLSSPNEKAWLAARFQKSHSTPLVLEVGTGSGVVIAFLASNAREIFGRDILSMGVDVNEDACKATAMTVKKALTEQGSQSVFLGPVCADLFNANTPAAADVLIFNPPYVPTAELPMLPLRGEITENGFKYDSHMLELSYAGGIDGMEITWRLLAALPHVLSSCGVAYILLCAQNKPEEVKASLPRILEGKWTVDTIGSSGKKAGWERLVIIRIVRQKLEFVSSISLCS